MVELISSGSLRLQVFCGVAYNCFGGLRLSVLYGGLRRLRSAAEGSTTHATAFQLNCDWLIFWPLFAVNWKLICSAFDCFRAHLRFWINLRVINVRIIIIIIIIIVCHSVLAYIAQNVLRCIDCWCMRLWSVFKLGLYLDVVFMSFRKQKLICDINSYIFCIYLFSYLFNIQTLRGQNRYKQTELYKRYLLFLWQIFCLFTNYIKILQYCSHTSHIVFNAFSTVYDKSI